MLEFLGHLNSSRDWSMLVNTEKSSMDDANSLKFRARGTTSPLLYHDFISPVLVETERLILRKLRASDSDSIFRFCSNPEMTRYTLWDRHLTLEDTHQLTYHYVLQREAEGAVDPLGIILKQDWQQEIIGTIGCHWVDQNSNCMELGYNIAFDYWGKGIATEASRGLIDYVFRHMPIERIQVRILSENIQSIRVAEKIGLVYEGKLRSALYRYQRYWDILIYGILRGEWKNRSGIQLTE